MLAAFAWTFPGKMFSSILNCEEEFDCLGEDGTGTLSATKDEIELNQDSSIARFLSHTEQAFMYIPDDHAQIQLRGL